MTKEEAIEWLKSLNYCDGEETQEVAQAVDIAIKELEKPTMDKAMIHTLAKENDELKAEIGRLRQALEQQPSEDCVSRAEVDKLCIRYLKSPTDEHVSFYEEFCSLPPVTPTQCIATVQFSKEELRDICNERIEVACQHGTCKDCKHWKDSDGVYRRGIGAKSKCPINIKEVYEGNFYCKDFERKK